MPALGEQQVHDRNGGCGFLQQHFIDQDRDQQGHWRGKRGANDGNDVCIDQLPAMTAHHPQESAPAIRVNVSASNGHAIFPGNKT